MDKIEKKILMLKDLIKNLESVGVAYSGGLDSSLLLFFSKQVLGDKVTAFTLRSQFQKSAEIKKAKEFTKRHCIKHIILEKDILEIPEVRDNSYARCYFCKRSMMQEILKNRDAFPFNALIDGTNCTDAKKTRPGIKALKELSVKSPFIEAGIDKKDILEIAGRIEFDHPSRESESCLATRFPYGKKIDKKMLDNIEAAEDKLNKLGFRQVRLRDHMPIARLEISLEDFERLDPISIKKIVDAVKDVGFDYVTLDLEGFKSGSMDRS